MKNPQEHPADNEQLGKHPQAGNKEVARQPKS
jgi:hypothetical protein